MQCGHHRQCGHHVSAAKLSQRYITDRQLPDKAIDLIDEAASRIRMEIDSKPEAMDKRRERRLIQLKIEREAVKKDTDPAAQKRQVQLLDEQIDIAELEREFADLEEIWKAEKGVFARRRPDQVLSWSRPYGSLWKPPGGPAISTRMAAAAVRPDAGAWRSVWPVGQGGSGDRRSIAVAAQQGHRGGGRRSGSREVDRYTGVQDAGRRDRDKLLRMEDSSARSG